MEYWLSVALNQLTTISCACTVGAPLKIVIVRRYWLSNAANGMVRPCSCPYRLSMGLETRGAHRHVQKTDAIVAGAPFQALHKLGGRV